MTLEAYKYFNPELILDKMRREEEKAVKRELKQMEIHRKKQSRKHAKQVRDAKK